jgi:hypothetical protein
MKRLLRSVLGAAMIGSFVGVAAAAPVVVFEEHGFPTIDTSVVPADVLHQGFRGADFVTSRTLADRLKRNDTRLLVLPYGSAFPEAQWPAIRDFLRRGGNLLTLGGRPFTRAVAKDGTVWRPHPEAYQFARTLLISDYQATPGSEGLMVGAATAGLQSLQWKRAYSMVIRLSQQETEKRIGTSGTYDAALRPLVWGDRDQQRLAAPAVEVDHFQNDYAGGRWVMLNCQLDDGVWRQPDAAAFLSAMADEAQSGAELFRVTPDYPLFLADEGWRFDVTWNPIGRSAAATLDLVVRRDGTKEAATSIALKASPSVAHVAVATTGKPGYHTVDAILHCGDRICGSAHTAFWVRDRAYLASGPAVSVTQNYFTVGGKPIAVVGTTYMDSQAQRLMFRYPDPYLWDRDMGQIAGAGFNMLRTGIWTDWSQIADTDGTLNERGKRTIEAFLMTARRHGLPVQFTMFAFMPEVFGGANPYLDPIGVRRQHAFAASLAKSFADVPFLMWDLINEPSFDNPAHFFTTMPNGDAIESRLWNDWLLQRYGSREAVARAWHAVLADGPIAVPGEADATAQSANDGGRPLAVTDFALFAQQSFRDWAVGMRAAIRAAGSTQLITVGQDEGGGLISMSPNFFKEAVDFTTTHSWWFNDDLLWDSLAAKQSGMPMLVQETGVMPEMNADGRPRRTPVDDGALLERKIGMALATGAGAIEWLWDINALMRSQQEVTIGAVRPDGTERPEAAVLRSYAAFAGALGPHIGNPAPADVAILTSQAAQYSVLQTVASDAQHRSVRVMNYDCRTPSRMVGENHVAEIAGAKLVVLPSALMLRDETWQALLRYVHDGGTLLVTGSAERDEHWQLRDRLKALGIDAVVTTLKYRSYDVAIDGMRYAATFSNLNQRALEVVHLPGDEGIVDVGYGKGRVLAVAAPVELAEASAVTAAVYRYALRRAGIVAEFSAGDLPASVLVRPVKFSDSTLYLFTSEDAADRTVAVHDGESGATLTLMLPAGRSKMMLIDRRTGGVLASYNGPDFAAEK